MFFDACVWLLARHSDLQHACLGRVRRSGELQGAFSQYCYSCHNQRLKTAGLALDTLDASKPTENPEVWEKVIGKLRLRTMPPKGAPRPSEETYREVTSWLEGKLDEAAAAHPWAGRPALHRLNRSEYKNAIRDLLALDIDAAALLPPDDSAYGFDNISEALGLSPALQEHYLAAAMKIGALATGDMKMAAGGETWRIPSQPLAGRAHGGNAARHHRRISGQLQLSAGRRICFSGQALPDQSEYHAGPGSAASGRVQHRRSTDASHDHRRAGGSRESV